MKWVSLTLLLASLTQLLPAQPLNLGLPLITNLDKQAYGGGTRTWGFCQGDRGMVFAANNEGVMMYDGTSWHTYPLPNRTIVRSVLWHDGKLWAGGQNEFGYFVPDSSGNLTFHSLQSLVPDEAAGFADVWKILPLEEGYLIRTTTYILKYADDKVSIVGPKGSYPFIGKAGAEILIQEESRGAYYYYRSPADLIPVAPLSQLKDTRLVEILPLDSGLLILTSQSGAWMFRDGKLRQWKTSTQSQFTEWRIAAAVALDDGNIAIGTERAGILFFSPSGRLLRHINRAMGLQNNRVLSCFSDASGTLWTGLDYGISVIATHSPFSFLSADGDLRGATYTIKRHKGYLYAGTSSGLYGMRMTDYLDPLQPQPWQLIPGTDGQVWGMDVVGDNLWLAHNEGAFLIKGLSAQQIAGTEGVWTFQAVVDQPNHVLMGTYTGLGLLTLNANGPSFAGYLSGFEASSRFLIQRVPGEAWVSHPYKGVYRIQMDLTTLRCTSVKIFGADNGLPSDLMNHIFDMHDQVVVAAEKGLFRFDHQQDRFVPMQALDAWLPPTTRIIRLLEDSSGNIWFLTESEVGVLWITDRGLEKEVTRQTIPVVREQMVAGFEYLYPMNEDHVFFGLEQGIMSYYPQPDSAPQLGKTLLTHLVAQGAEKEIEIGTFWPEDRELSLSPQAQSIRFTCGVGHLPPSQIPEFRYRLIGVDTSWSDWTQIPVKEYTQIGWGDFVFEAQARALEAPVLSPLRFSFSISPPWYVTLTAKVIYVLLGLGFVFALILIPRRRFEREKAELQDEHRVEVAQNQAEINSLREEKLTAEVQHKTRELATATMHLVQKNELITHLNHEISQILSQHPDHPSNKSLKQILRTLSHDQQFEADWEQFVTHFDKVHAGFLRRLQEAYPNLTPKDQRMCAYLRLNLSTKEIAPLMNISVRGVEISRYRLRKKLNLERETNLSEFIMKF